MKRFQFSLPSPAMIVAIVALIAALAGSAYAAKKIGSHQLKKNAVTTNKIKDGAVTSGKLAQPVVAVTMRQGPDTTIPAGPGGFGTAEASCQPGERATGGGFFNPSVYYLVLTASYPTPNPGNPPPTGNGKVPTGWKVWVANTGTGSQTVQAYVVCVK
jgi:hypothetical protein